MGFNSAFKGLIAILPSVLHIFKNLFSLIFICNEQSDRLIVLTVSLNTKYEVGDFMEYVVRKVLLSCDLLMMIAADRRLRLLCYCGRISRRLCILLIICGQQSGRCK